MARGGTACCGPFLAPPRPTPTVPARCLGTSVSWHRAGWSPREDDTGPQAFWANSTWSPPRGASLEPQRFQTQHWGRVQGGGGSRVRDRGRRGTAGGSGASGAVRQGTPARSVRRGSGWPRGPPRWAGLRHGRRCLTPAPRPPGTCPLHRVRAATCSPQHYLQTERSSGAGRPLHHGPCKGHLPALEEGPGVRQRRRQSGALGHACVPTIPPQGRMPGPAWRV